MSRIPSPLPSSNEHRVWTAIEKGRIGIWQADLEKQSVAQSDFMTLLLGLGPNASTDHLDDWKGRLHADDVAGALADLEAVAQGGIYQSEYRAILPDGSHRWISVSGEAVPGSQGKRAVVTAVARDVTPQKESEQAFRESRTRLLMALKAGKLATWQWDLKTGVIHWSEEHYTVLGLTPGSGEETYEQFASRVHPDDLTLVETAIETARRNRVEYHAEYRVIWPDGSEHTLESRGQFSFDSAGQALSMEGVVADISERKRDEELIQRKQKLESIGLLAGGIAHDFNNLLTGILGGASLVIESTPHSDPNYSMLEGIIASSERAAALTRQLLAYSGKGRHVVGDLDLSQVVGSAIVLAETAKPDSIQLHLGLREGLPSVRGDEGQVQQVVVILATNAIEAIGEKGGTIRINTGEQEISEYYIASNLAAAENEIAPGPYVFVEVRDNGCGMDEHIKSRIFDPFFTTKFTGRGLGLAAVQGIVRAHGGTIEVNSTPGTGSTFKVLFPVAAKPKESLAPGAGAPETVLVVDNEALVRNTVRTLLERSGYRVMLAENSGEAIELVRAHAAEIAAVVLDIATPEADSSEACRALKRLKPILRIIISSSAGELELLRHFDGADAPAFLRKPYRAAQLLEAVKSGKTPATDG